MKVERFIKEYANYQIKGIETNHLIEKELKIFAIDKIERAIKCREKGLITVEEAIKTIMYCVE